MATRFEPEVFVPPLPGRPAKRARGRDRDEALYFDRMPRRLPAGLSRDGEPVFLDVDFLDGTARRARQHLGHQRRGHEDHLRAVPALRPVPLRGARRVRHEHEGDRLQRQGRGPALARPAQRAARRARRAPSTSGSGCRPGRSRRSGCGRRRGPARGRVGPAPGGAAIPQVEGRTEGVTAYYWTIREFVRERYLRFLFAEGGRRALADRRPGRAGRVAPRPLVPGRPRGAGDGPSSTGARIGVVRGPVRRDRAQARRRRRRLARPAVRGHGRRVPAPARSGPPPGRPPDLGRRAAEDPARAPDRLGGEPGHGHRHPQPPRPGQAVRDRGDDQAPVRAQGADGPARAAPFPRPRRAQPLRPARGLEPDQGGPARRRRARPQPRDHPDRRRADRIARSSAGSSPTRRSGSSAGSTWPRRSAREYGFLPARHPGPGRILKPGSVIVQQPSHPDRRSRSASRSRAGRPGPRRPRRRVATRSPRSRPTSG